MTSSVPVDMHPDMPNPALALTRRGFVAATIGSGFAAAVQPVRAEAIKTDIEGLEAGGVEITAGDGAKFRAYRAFPADETNCPVVLVISEIFGVHEYIADVCRRLAKLGYCAIAPDLYSRQGDPGSYQDIERLLAEVVSKVPDAQVMGDLDATVAWAKKNGFDTGRLGITGFCWGGRITWLYTAHNPDIKAGVAWYGRLVGTPSELAPKNPVDVVGSLAAPVLGLYGGKDTGISQANIATMKDALKTGSPAAQLSTFVVYPQAGHAFHADYRASYVKAAADDGWKRCIAWFKAHGVA